MDKDYRLARIVILIFTILFFFILLMDQDASTKFILISLFTGIIYVVALLGKGISKKMVQIGQKIKRLGLRIFYYFLILVLILTLSVTFIHVATWYALDILPPVKDLGEGLNIALTTIFIEMVFFIILFIPYIQALLVLIIGKIKKIQNKYSMK